MSVSGHSSVVYDVSVGSIGQISSTGDDSITGGVCREYQETIFASGTFVKNSDATWDVTGVNGVPSGWTVITE